MQYSMDILDDRAGALNRRVGPQPVLHICAGTMPKLITDPATSNLVLAAKTLPIIWITDPVNGMVKAPAEIEMTAEQDGTAAFFRLYNSAGVCKMQGTIAAKGGTADMILDVVQLKMHQRVRVAAFEFSEL